MRGSGLKRFDPQAGSGFFRDMLYDAAVAGVKGLKKDFRNPKKAIRTAASNAKTSAKRSLKRKARQLTERASKRVINDIFGKPTPYLPE